MWVSLVFLVGHLTHKLNDYGGEEVLRSHCPHTVAFSCRVLCGFPPPLTTTAVVPIESVCQLVGLLCESAPAGTSYS